jgi:hypothetical protein
MTDERREFLRANLYIVAGFLPGLAVGTIFCATPFGRAFLDPLRFPQDIRVMITFMVPLIGAAIIHYLRRGWLASEQPKQPERHNDLSQSNT